MLTSLVAHWKLNRLIGGWTEYREAVLAAREPGAVTAGQEEAFLALKARIAAWLPLLTSASPPSAALDSQNHMRGMTELLNRYRGLAEGTPAGRDREEFERLWHDHFLYLNKLKGMKLGAFSERKTPAARRLGQTPTGIPQRRRHASLPGLWMLRFAFQLVILVGIVYAISWVLGVQRDAVTGRLIMGRTRNLGEVGAAGGQLVASVWNGALSFFDPVVKSYGPESTIVLVGLLLLGAGYWTFIRRS